MNRLTFFVWAIVFGALGVYFDAGVVIGMAIAFGVAGFVGTKYQGTS